MIISIDNDFPFKLKIALDKFRQITEMRMLEVSDSWCVQLIYKVV
jgi:hypothetical protein